MCSAARQPACRGGASRAKHDSLGLLYYYVTQALGFIPLRHEGKVLGLAAFGQPVHARELRQFYWVDADGQVRAKETIRQTAAKLEKLAQTTKREDLAASVQQVLEDITLEALGRMLARNPSRNLGVSGGVFANVKLTQRIAEKFDLDECSSIPPCRTRARRRAACCSISTSATGRGSGSPSASGSATSCSGATT